MPEPIHIITVPYASGKRNFRTATGPEAILRAGLVRELEAAGRIVALVQGLEYAPNDEAEMDAVFEMHRRVSVAVESALGLGHFPLILAGNCSTTVGVSAALPKDDLGVVWLDAYGDSSTPDTTTYGILDNMCLAYLTGRCFHALTQTIPHFTPLPGNRVLHVGGRGWVDNEDAAMRKSGIHLVTGDDLKQGGKAALEQGIADLSGEGVGHVHLHFDFSVLDPGAAPASDHDVPDGLPIAVAGDILQTVRQAWPLTSATFASYDATHDPDGRTARAGVSLIRALIG